MKNTKVVLSVVGFIALFIFLTWFGIYMKKTFNYNWFYKSAVQETVRKEIEPLQVRITNLEREVSMLKTNR